MQMGLKRNCETAEARSAYRFDFSRIFLAGENKSPERMQMGLKQNYYGGKEQWQ